MFINKNNRIIDNIFNIIDSPYVFLLPGILALFLVITFPLVYTIVLSFTDFSFLKEGVNFIGVNNYIKILSDSATWKSLRITAIYVILSVSFQLVIGISIATLLNNDFKGKTIARALIVVPMLLSPVVVGAMWRMFFWPEFGLVDFLLSLVGLSGLEWLSNPKIALFTVIFTEIWASVPFTILVTLAALEGLPPEPLEAAKVDGASSFATFFYVILPQIMPVAIIVLLIKTIDALRAFGIIFSMTEGGPGNATETLNFSIYVNAFRYLRVGEASSLAVVLTFVIAIVAFIFIKIRFKEASI